MKNFKRLKFGDHRFHHRYPIISHICNVLTFYITNIVQDIFAFKNVFTVSY